MDNVLKVAITGHTKGIGSSIYNKFKTNGHLTAGYSRTTGYDITDINVQDKILKQCEDFDIFVNNAYAPKAQTVLLEKFINQWKNTNKLIINLSSKLVFYPGKTNDF